MLNVFCLFWIYLWCVPEWNWNCILFLFHFWFSTHSLDVASILAWLLYFCSLHKISLLFFPHISIGILGALGINVYVRFSEGRNNTLLVIIINMSSSVECCNIIRFHFLSFSSSLSHYVCVWFPMCLCTLYNFSSPVCKKLLRNIKRMMQTFCVFEI